MANTPESSLSKACKVVADFLNDKLSAGNWLEVSIGNLADAHKPSANIEYRINLYFYNFEPSGFFPDIAPEDTWWLKTYCLITAFSFSESSDESSGEGELGLLGNVIRVFHESPVLTADISGTDFLLQIIYHPLSVDALNNLWSTQSEAIQRASIAYEISLCPVIPEKEKSTYTRAGAFGTEVRPEVSSKTKTEKFSGKFPDDYKWPHVTKTEVDILPEDWAPAICFVHNNECAQILYFLKGSAELADFKSPVWIAGEKDAKVTLQWEVWTRSGGWVKKTGKDVTIEQPDIDPAVIDPDLVDKAKTVNFAPTGISIPADEISCQAMLYAIRKYKRGFDQLEIEVRSNPLLVTIYKNP
ncbi:hypothetical protein CEE37_12235 [candidate division LCP-89 bacterium B3_LCP]|uniref:Pvc16 N-terminal domain-containing protein n=1 Tax=candidate division LCP-89 bacterium B3_LCP TaxID=2012998 RepID=A0A532UUB0_UNCL8|nr:MAG: hypothetical protein CEE37_12235 [candidate division LCP-89 bacterium B3_LCP]